MRLLDKVKRLSAAQYENLVYDLLVLSGLRNAVWRTPGADAGRDIEGVFLSVDLSESVTTERWYVECKRYAAALSWPQVYEKLAYAHNHQADFLLFVTTATLSPRCKEEISKRDGTKTVPRIRFWDAALLESIISRHPELLVKYRLSRDPAKQVASLSALTMTTLKVIHSAYGNASVSSAVDPALECAAALVEVILTRSSSDESGATGLAHGFNIDRDLYPWCAIDGSANLDVLEACGLRALLSVLRFLAKAQVLRIRQASSGTFEISMDRGGAGALSPAANRVLATVALMSNFEVTAMEPVVIVRARGAGW